MIPPRSFIREMTAAEVEAEVRAERVRELSRRYHRRHLALIDSSRDPRRV